jgi:hypothetical protein
MTTRYVRMKVDSMGRGRIEVDGVDLSGEVSGVEFSSGVGRYAQTSALTVKFAVAAMDLEGEMTVEVEQDMREALIALGWTPPSAADDGPIQ